jgi:DeoR family fructose operon transcriptional repressor
MKAAERQLRLRQIFEQQEFADLETLSRLLATSESSVRRDLTMLEKQGTVRRVHGGALAAQSRRAATSTSCRR